MSEQVYEPRLEPLYRALKIITIYVKNTLDQDVTVTIKGNISRSTDGGVQVGTSFTVGAGSSDARTLTPSTSGWLPYVWVELQCSTAPTSGEVDVWAVKDRNIMPKIVDGLEIRDTNIHSPDSDPDKIIIVWW